MPQIFTYSFETTSVVVNHPQFGVYSAYGTGLGILNVAYDNDITTHDVAADLAVVVSKSAKKNGTVTFEILQSSDFNDWLKRFNNYVTAADPSQFATASIVITNKSTNDTFTCTGVSPQKMAADAVYQSQSQNRTWAYKAANIEMT